MSEIQNTPYYYHGYDEEGNPDYDIDGWVQWNGEIVAIPHGLWVNPLNTMPFDTVIYNVFSLRDASFHDVTLMTETNIWEANIYDTDGVPSNRYQWDWDEASDIVLSQYIVNSDQTIYSAQLFTPPKKYSELVEGASSQITQLDLSLNQTEVFNRLTNNGTAKGLYMTNDGDLYINADYINSGTLTLGGAENQRGSFKMLDENNNIIGEWDKDGMRTEWFNFQSGSQSAYIGKGDSDGIRNVYIDNDSIDIRNGQEVLASFGETVTIGKQSGAHMEASSNRLSFKLDTNEIAYVSVDPNTQESVFYMTKAIVVQDLFFGLWRWQSRNNNNLALKWMGSDE